MFSAIKSKRLLTSPLRLCFLVPLLGQDLEELDVPGQPRDDDFRPHHADVRYPVPGRVIVGALEEMTLDKYRLFTSTTLHCSVQYACNTVK